MKDQTEGKLAREREIAQLALTNQLAFLKEIEPFKSLAPSLGKAADIAIKKANAAAAEYVAAHKDLAGSNDE